MGWEENVKKWSKLLPREHRQGINMNCFCLFFLFIFFIKRQKTYDMFTIEAESMTLSVHSVHGIQDSPKGVLPLNLF